MKSGYDQFFKQARRATAPSKPAAENIVRIRQKLVADKKERKAKNSRKSSLKFLLICTMGFLFSGAAYIERDRIDNLVSHVEVGFFGEALAETAATKTEKKSEEKKADNKDANTKGAHSDATTETKQDAKSDMVEKKDYTKEDIDHFVKLNDRKRELDLREEELNKMDAELQAQKAALDKRLSELEDTRRQISSVLDQKVKADDKKVDRLVEMYSNMRPNQSAKIFETMDEDLAIDILGRMKKKNAAEIMNLLTADKAKVFSEKFAGYRVK